MDKFDTFNSVRQMSAEEALDEVFSIANSNEEYSGYMDIHGSTIRGRIERALADCKEGKHLFEIIRTPNEPTKVKCSLCDHTEEC